MMKRIIRIKEETKDIAFDLLERGYEVLVEDDKNTHLLEEHFGNRLIKSYGYYKLKNRKPFIVRERQTATEFEFFDTLEEAQSYMQKAVAEDKKFNIYEPRFYEIYHFYKSEILEVSE